MKLRKKTKYEIDSYFKMFEIRKNSMAVLDTLQDLFKREQIKTRQNLLEQAAFETQFDAVFKDRSAQYPKAVLGDSKLLRRIETARDYQELPLKIEVEKKYHPMFYHHLPREVQERDFPHIVNPEPSIRPNEIPSVPRP